MWYEYIFIYNYYILCLLFYDKKWDNFKNFNYEKNKKVFLNLEILTKRKIKVYKVLKSILSKI